VPPTPSGAEGAAAGAAAQPGTRADDDVVDFDPTVGNAGGGDPDASNPDPSRNVPGATPGDRSASGTVEGSAGAGADPNAAAAAAAQAAAAGGAADDDADPAAEALDYYQSLTGKPKPGTETTTDDDKTLTPESIRAEIESATQDPKQRFDNLLSRVGGITNELGQLRKAKAATEPAIDGMRPFLDFDPTTNLPVGFNGLRMLQFFTEKLGPDAINEQLAEAGLELIQKGSRASGGTDQGDVLGPIAAEVAKLFKIETEGLDEDAVLAEIQSRPRANFELNRRLQAAEAQRIATQQEGKASERAGLQRERTEIHGYFTDLQGRVKDPKVFDSVRIAVAKLDGTIPKDKPLRGLRRAEVLHRLAEAERFPEVLQAVTQRVRTQEHARVTTALRALGWSAADAAALLKSKAAKAAAAPGGEAVPAAAEDGSHDTWTK